MDKIELIDRKGIKILPENIEVLLNLTPKDVFAILGKESLKENFKIVTPDGSVINKSIVYKKYQIEFSFLNDDLYFISLKDIKKIYIKDINLSSENAILFFKKLAKKGYQSKERTKADIEFPELGVSFYIHKDKIKAVNISLKFNLIEELNEKFLFKEISYSDGSMIYLFENK